MDQGPLPPFVLFSRRLDRIQVILHGTYVFDPDLIFRLELVIQQFDADDHIVAQRRFNWDV